MSSKRRTEDTGPSAKHVKHPPRTTDLVRMVLSEQQFASFYKVFLACRGILGDINLNFMSVDNTENAPEGMLISSTDNSKTTLVSYILPATDIRIGGQFECASTQCAGVGTAYFCSQLKNMKDNKVTITINQECSDVITVWGRAKSGDITECKIRLMDIDEMIIDTATMDQYPRKYTIECPQFAEMISAVQTTGAEDVEIFGSLVEVGIRATGEYGEMTKKVRFPVDSHDLSLIRIHIDHYR